MPRSLLTTLVLPAAAVVALTLSGCGTGSTPAPSSSGSGQPEASEGPSSPTSFTPPSTCTELLGAELEAQFFAEGNVLFSDTTGAGLYPSDSIGQDGGDTFACLYGQDLVDYSTFEVSAQAVDEQEHEGILAELQSRGYVQDEEADRTVFTQVGFEGTRDDPNLDAAIVHLLYPDGWITAYSTFGGEARLTEILGWADIVAAQRY